MSAGQRPPGAASGDPSTSREEILARVRRNQPAPCALPELRRFDHAADAPLDHFREGVARMGGRIVDTVPGENLDTCIARLFSDARVICSATGEGQARTSTRASRVFFPMRG
jgi:hypothetical protein